MGIDAAVDNSRHGNADNIDVIKETERKGIGDNEDPKDLLYLGYI